LGSVSLVLPRQAASLALARGAVRDYVKACCDDAGLAYTAQLATSEVVASFLDEAGEQLTLEVQLVCGVVEVVVRGYARPLASMDADLRLRLLDALTDDMTVSVDEAGERVAVRLAFQAATGR
jgi:hypothetical protein